MDGAELEFLDLEGDPLVGTVLDGRYEIQSCIGEGGMGRVYKAKHTRMSRVYAIKVLFGDLAGDKRMRARFSREAEAVSRLQHPNVISVVDFGESESGLLYLVMDLAEGQPLSDIIESSAPMQAQEIRSILVQVCLGLGHAHKRGLIHRDFKGENVIIVPEDGRQVAKIVDFGICMMMDQTQAATMLTSEGIVVGTPAMMSPEQATGDQVDHRTDQFSLGVVLYHMLSGKLPFDGSPLDMARQNLYAKVDSVIDRTGHDVDPILESIAHKLMAKKPGERYDNIRDVVGIVQLEMGTGDNFFTYDQVSSEYIAPAHLGIRENETAVDPQSSAGYGETEYVHAADLRPKTSSNLRYGVIAGAALVAMVALYSIFGSSKTPPTRDPSSATEDLVASRHVENSFSGAAPSSLKSPDETKPESVKPSTEMVFMLPPETANNQVSEDIKGADEGPTAKKAPESPAVTKAKVSKSSKPARSKSEPKRRTKRPSVSTPAKKTSSALEANDVSSLCQQAAKIVGSLESGTAASRKYSPQIASISWTSFYANPSQATLSKMKSKCLSIRRGARRAAKK